MPSIARHSRFSYHRTASAMAHKLEPSKASSIFWSPAIFWTNYKTYAARRTRAIGHLSFAVVVIFSLAYALVTSLRGVCFTLSASCSVCSECVITIVESLSDSALISKAGDLRPLMVFNFLQHWRDNDLYPAGAMFPVVTRIGILTVSYFYYCIVQRYPTKKSIWYWAYLSCSRNRRAFVYIYETHIYIYIYIMSFNQRERCTWYTTASRRQIDRALAVGRSIKR